MSTYYTLKCDKCNCEFKRLAKNMSKHHAAKNHFCSRECSRQFQNTLIPGMCHICSIPILSKFTDVKRSKSGKNFCSTSCAATYNNTIRRKSQRSKCEIHLYELLSAEFPSLTIIPNDKTMLKGLEVDIAIPELKLGIEWNGIIHFKPIYGNDKLLRTQTKDAQKLELANQLDINLVVIPDLTSRLHYVEKVFQDIKQIIIDLQS